MYISGWLSRIYDRQALTLQAKAQSFRSSLGPRFLFPQLQAELTRELHPTSTTRMTKNPFRALCLSPNTNYLNLYFVKRGPLPEGGTVLETKKLASARFSFIRISQ